MLRADKVFPFWEQVRKLEKCIRRRERGVVYQKTENNGRKEPSNESFPGLFRWQLDQWCLSPFHSEKISAYVVCDDKQRRKYKPNQPLEDVIHNSRRLGYNEQVADMSPAELSELIAIVALLKREHKEQETGYPQHKGDEIMVLHQKLRQKLALLWKTQRFLTLSTWDRNTNLVSLLENKFP